MKKLLLSLSLLVFTTNIFAQKSFEIALEDQLIDLQDPAFYVQKVIDNRSEKKHIGIVKKGFFNKKTPATFEKGFTNALTRFYQMNVPRGSYQQPITVKVSELKIEEQTEMTTEYAIATFHADYYYKDQHLFSDQQTNKMNAVDVTSLHQQNIRYILSESVKAFAASNWKGKIDTKPLVEASPEASGADQQDYKGETTKAQKENTRSVQKTASNSGVNEGQNQYQDTTTTEDENLEQAHQSRNIFAIGYQLGGLTLAGVNYEIRVHDYFGIHFGAGLAGLTGGVKIHTNPSRDSFFFNLSVKDGGFGGMQTAGVEFGGRWVFKDGGRFGLHYQIGLAGILSITEQMEEAIYGDDDVPDATLVMGIGFSW